MTRWPLQFYCHFFFLIDILKSLFAVNLTAICDRRLWQKIIIEQINIWESIINLNNLFDYLIWVIDWEKFLPQIKSIQIFFTSMNKIISFTTYFLFLHGSRAHLTLSKAFHSSSSSNDDNLLSLICRWQQDSSLIDLSPIDRLQATMVVVLPLLQSLNYWRCCSNSALGRSMTRLCIERCFFLNEALVATEYSPLICLVVAIFPHSFLLSKK